MSVSKSIWATWWKRLVGENGQFILPLAIPVVVGFVVYNFLSRSNSTFPPDTVTSAADEESVTVWGIRLMSISEDGQYLDVAREIQGHIDWDRRDAHTGRRLFLERVSEDLLIRLQFSGRDQIWAGLNMENQLEVIRNGTLLWREFLPEQAPGEILERCSLCPKRNLIAVVSGLGSLWLLKYDLTQVVPLGRFSLGQKLVDASLSPTGDTILVVTADLQFLLWDVNEQKVVQKLQTDGHEARFASWSGDAHRIVTFGQDRKLSVWDSATGRLNQQVEVDNQGVISAELSFDGSVLAVGDGYQVQIWDLPSGTRKTLVTGHPARIRALQFADGDRTLFLSDNAGGLRRWSASDAREVWSAP